MKIAVFLLALANLLFFAFTQGYFGYAENPDAVRLQKQVSPERIVVVSRGEPPPDGDKAPAKAEPAAAPPASEAKAEPAKPADICLAWQGLSGDSADQLAALLKEQFGDFKLARRAAPAAGGSWWVYIPPQTNKAEADKKATELRKMGITDFFVISEAGADRWAISLGVFSSEAGGKERLAFLKDKGVRSAKLGPRKTKDATHDIEARGPADRQKPLQDAVASLSAELKGKACP